MFKIHHCMNKTDPLLLRTPYKYIFTIQNRPLVRYTLGFEDILSRVQCVPYTVTRRLNERIFKFGALILNYFCYFYYSSFNLIHQSITSWSL